MSSHWPIYLVTGLGTDAAIFSLQKMAFPQIQVIELPEPLAGEALPDYGRRLAESLAQRGPCLIGGISMGGMVALEMSRHLDARGCFLISSLKGREQLPLWAWLGRPVMRWLPSHLDRRVARGGELLLRSFGNWLPARLKMLATQMSKTQAPALNWAAYEVTHWRATVNDWPCPVFQIHGSRDPLFPLRWITPDEVVPGGGHHLTLTHPFIVNGWLQQCITLWELRTRGSATDGDASQA